MIIPPTTASYTPVYIYQDSTPDTQKCLELSENADILQKTLQGEPLTDEESQRITTCVAERKETTYIVATVILLFFLGIVVCAFLAGMFT